MNFLKLSALVFTLACFNTLNLQAMQNDLADLQEERRTIYATGGLTEEACREARNLDRQIGAINRQINQNQNRTDTRWHALGFACSLMVSVAIPYIYLAINPTGSDPDTSLIENVINVFDSFLGQQNLL